jgi:PAS domain S-box-containing protein
LPRSKQDETALAESEETFRVICQAAFDGFMVHENGLITAVNDQCAAIFRCTPREMIGRSILEFTAPTMHEPVLEAVRTRSEQPFESIGIRADGTRFPLELCGVTKRGSNVRVVALRDMTERLRANEELRRREERFRVLSHVAFDGILMERDGIVDEANESFAEMFGYDPGALPGRSVDSLIRVPERVEPEGRLHATGIRGDGTAFPVALCVATAADGQRIYAVRDVTREKRAQEQLSESERRYRELSEATHDLLCLHDLEGNILEVNSAFLRSIGYPYDELDGANIRKFLTPRSAIGFDDYLRTITTEGTAEGHMSVLTKSGERRLWHFRNVLQISGNRSYVRGLARDVTAQEQAALALQKSEAHFRSIIEHISDTISIIDDSGSISYQSPSVERVLGYKVEELTQTHYADLVHPDDLPAAREFFTAQLNKPGAKGALDIRIRHRDGSWRWLSMVATAHRTSKGLSIIVNGRDVTERRLLLAQLEQAKRVNSLGHLAATVAHEFNNVLMGMLPFAELMQRPAVSPQNIAKGASYIISSIARGKRVALDILRFTQPASPSFAEVDLARWWERLVPELQASTGNSISLEWSIPENLAVTADASQLAQVLSNLVSNARDAMPQGGRLGIVVRRPDVDETFPFGVVEHPETFVQFSVSDTGAGMTEDVVSHIFEPLFTTKRNGGTGLGLAVVHQVVERHRGAIFVDSQPGQGTTFHLFIPAAVTEPRVAEPARAPQLLGAMNILIVDDEPGIVDGVAELLQRDGATTRTASSGAEALEAAETFAADVAMVDIKLPDGDGIDLGEKLRARRPELRIVYVSGHADSRRVPESDPYVAFLQKPFPISRLVDEIVRRGWGACT